MRTQLRLFFLFLLLCFSGIKTACHSQSKQNTQVNSAKNVNVDEWEDQRKDYFFEDLEKPKKQKDDPELPDMNGNILSWSSGIKNFAMVILALLYILVIIGIAYLIKLNIKKKSNKATSFDGDIEKNLLETDIDYLLNLARQQNNYKQIIRFTFLALLKSMVEKNILIWEKEFTIRNFINQLNKSTKQSDFKKLTGFYERKWFNNELSTADEANFYEEKCRLFNIDIEKTLTTPTNHTI